MKMHVRRMAALLAAALVAGCATPPPPDPGPARDPALQRAEAYFEVGSYTDALIECIELSRRDPHTPGLPEMQNRIMQALTAERAQRARARSQLTPRRGAVDVEERGILPDTYGLLRFIRGETGPLRTPMAPPSRMRAALAREVTVDLLNVSLEEFVRAVGAAEDINIIIDDDLADLPRTLTLEADGVPLSEILDYVSRNLDVNVHVGENIVWVTPRDRELSYVRDLSDRMQTRVYRLRKGLSHKELGGEQDGELGLSLIEAIELFVPEVDEDEDVGTRFYFDRKSHVLIVRNTPDNLARVEDLIDALDVSPPQIQIEARFITLGKSNLRDLGIDWLLDSHITLTRQAVQQDGQRLMTPRTQIMGTESGPSRTPQTRIGVGGLDLAFQGVLTDPAFRAVLYALDASGDSKILSVPRVTTVNNRMARVEVAKKIPYFETIEIERERVLVDVGPPRVWDVIETIQPIGRQNVEPGYKLEVRPSVGSDMESISLWVRPEISEFLGWEYFEFGSQIVDDRDNGIGVPRAPEAAITRAEHRLPIEQVREVETEVVVRSGETVVMGGLITSTESTSTDGVPILSSVPLIGRFFRHERKEIDQENLLIFVTATIISERGENLIPMFVPEEPEEEEE